MDDLIISATVDRCFGDAVVVGQECNDKKRVRNSQNDRVYPLLGMVFHQGRLSSVWRDGCLKPTLVFTSHVQMCEPGAAQSHKEAQRAVKGHRNG